jgi:hypothetical protein
MVAKGFGFCWLSWQQLLHCARLGLSKCPRWSSFERHSPTAWALERIEQIAAAEPIELSDRDLDAQLREATLQDE